MPAREASATRFIGVVWVPCAGTQRSYVKVPADLADDIIAAANGSKHGDVEVTVERARQ